MSSELAERGLAIRAEGLSKRYRLGARRPYRRIGAILSRTVLKRFRRTVPDTGSGILWALKDVSFSVREGEILGIIGANGSGKSTLLKILAKISRPTTGRAEIHGRVGSLLEVGTGFHPELSGRENVFLNGAILGMARREIIRKYDDIVEFAQIPGFMDTPVKHYSSGMRVRLAFSVAAQLEPEILFIDEVLAVGDAEFQEKCLGKMHDVGRSGRTVLFVSHNMGMITTLCTRALWLDQGSIRLDGDPQDVIEAYLSQRYSSTGLWQHPDEADCGERVRIRSVAIINGDGQPEPGVPFDEPVRIRVEHEVRETTERVYLRLRLDDVAGTTVLTTSNADTDSSQASWEPGVYRHTCTIPGALLRPGKYLLSAGAWGWRVGMLDEHEHCLGLEVLPIRFTFGERRRGVVTPVLPWILERSPSEVT